MREIEYYALGREKRLVYQIWIDEENFQLHIKFNKEDLPGYQMQVQGFTDINRVEERLAEMHRTLTSGGYTEVPFGYSEGMESFDSDIEEMRRAEAHQ